LAELGSDHLTLLGRFRVGGGLLGAYLGLVVMLKLIALSVYRTREAYQPDPATCFACGRCFAYCPQDHPRSPLALPVAAGGRS
jgi:ferredoxin